MKPHTLLLEKSLFSIQNSSPSLVLRSFKHLCAVMTLRSHCSAKLYVLHSFNVFFHTNPHSSLFPLNYLQHSIPLSDSRNLFELDSISCSQEHSVLSYSYDLNYFYEHILKVFSPVHPFLSKLQLCVTGKHQ